jgi:hypothetical protein
MSSRSNAQATMLPAFRNFIQINQVNTFNQNVCIE